MTQKKLRKGHAFIMSKEIEWETVAEGVERKILGFDDEVMMVCVSFVQGAIGTLHHHVHRQVTYIESGVFEVTIAGNKKILQKGDCFFVSPDLVHGVLALEEGTLIDIFTPAREDFI